MQVFVLKICSESFVALGRFTFAGERRGGWRLGEMGGRERMCFTRLFFRFRPDGRYAVHFFKILFLEASDQKDV